MWHASISARSGRTKRLVAAPGVLEREAVRLLAGVGGEVEWWFHSPTLVGHLRVAVTLEEVEVMPAGCAVHDAGESGPPRPRTR